MREWGRGKNEGREEKRGGRRKGGRRKEGRKEGEEEGRERYALVSPSRARALSSPLVTLLGPHHSMAVGAHGCLVTGLRCSLRPCVVVAGTGCGVVGAHGRSCLCPVVGCCGRGRSWAVGGRCARLRAWEVGGRCGWLCHDGGRCGWLCCDGGHCGWSCCDHRGRGCSSPFVFVGGRLSLLEVIVVGGCRRMLSLCVGGGW